MASDPVTSILNMAQEQMLPPQELELKGFGKAARQKANWVWDNGGGDGYVRNSAGRWVRTNKRLPGRPNPPPSPSPRGTRPPGTRSKTTRGVGRNVGGEFGRFYYRRGVRPAQLNRARGKRFAKMQSVSGQFINAVNTGGASYSLRGNSRRGINDIERVFCGTIQFKNDGTTSWASNPGGGETGGNMFFSPRSVYYINGNSEIGQRATRNLKYRIRGGVVTFIPCISGYSQPDWRLNAMMADTPDFLWGISTTSGDFVNSPVTPATNSTLTQNTIVSSKNACVRAAWNDEITCPIPRTKWLSTACPVAQNALIPFTATIANLRETIGFILCVSLSGATPASTTNAMNVWMDIAIDFKDQCPVSTIPTTLLAPLEPLELKQLRRILAAIKSDDEIDKLVEDVDDDCKSKPPSPTPSRSTVNKVKSSSLK